MKAISITSLFILPAGGSVQAKGFHDDIPSVFHGNWAPSLIACRDADGGEKLSIDGESITYYEGNDYLLLGIEFGGSMTKRGDSGSLFNGRFTSRLETNILGEHNMRIEVGNADRNVLYRYPIGEDGEPIASREVRSVRCTG